MGSSSSKALEMTEVAQRKRNLRDQKHNAFVPPVLNPELTQRILDASACELIELMRTGALTVSVYDDTATCLLVAVRWR